MHIKKKKMGKVREISGAELKALQAAGKKIVCDFWAAWCGPCRMLAPVIDTASEEFGDKAVFVKVDIDENPELSMRYGIMSIPLVSVFKNGAMSGKSLGYMSKTEAFSFLKENL